MGVLIQMKLILTDFIVFGIWCLNQKKKKSVCMGIDIPGHCKTFPKVCLTIHKRDLFLGKLGMDH